MIPILDNGHGGMINGVYQTAGKRSPNWQLGVLYEGMFNRWIVNALIERLDYLQIPYYHASPELTDITLGVRVERANQIYKQNKDAYFLSIHANAGGGTGWEIFTSPNTTDSDNIATTFIDTFNVSNSPFLIDRGRFDFSDGDADKEANFYILTKTHCPALLVECGFMDHPEDYKHLWDRDVRDEIVEDLLTAIIELRKK